jgi:NAD(P)-dependent dehydrogenase (short-subunit alcohol dehydrogenase family)
MTACEPQQEHVPPGWGAGKVAIITGAGSGIGLATARLLAQDGMTVVVNDLDADAADRAIQLIKGDGGRGMAFSGDASNPCVAREGVAHVVRAFGQVDLLINTAGKTNFAPAEEYTEWDSMLALNLSAPFHWAQQVARASMIPRRRGAIVNVSSLSGLAAHPLDCAYIAAKHGVVGLTKALAVDWACYGIRVNCVCPGVTETPILQSAPGDAQATLRQRIPLQRIAAAHEQARAIRFLSSDEASYVTGAILNVDGGILALKALFPPRTEPTAKADAG